MSNFIKEFAEGGGFSRPFLLHIYSTDNTKHAYIINDNQDLTYNGILYKASSFEYNPNNGGANLSVSLVDNDILIDIMDENYFFKCDAIGIFNGSEIEEIEQFRHMYGEGTWQGSSADIKFTKDDRLGMTFPALTFNSYNNKGAN